MRIEDNPQPETVKPKQNFSLDSERLVPPLGQQSECESSPEKLAPSQRFDNVNVSSIGEEALAEQLNPASAPYEKAFTDAGFQSTQSTSTSRRLVKFFLTSLLMLMIVELGLSFYQAWLTSPWLLGLYSTVTGLALILATKFGYREWRKLAKLKQVSTNQSISTRLKESMQMGEADRFINSLLAQHPDTRADAVSSYLAAQHDEHNDREKLMLYEQIVLRDQDRQASKLISRFSAEAALLLAASPLAVVDMAVMLWRNQRMLYQIAEIYGLKLGYWSRVRLVKGVLINMVYAGASELMGDIGGQLLSVELSGKLSARLAQGLGGGLLTARLGFQAMAVCRPLVFTDATKPKLSQVHQQLLTELKSSSLAAFSQVRNKKMTTPNKEKL